VTTGKTSTLETNLKIPWVTSTIWIKTLTNPTKFYLRKSQRKIRKIKRRKKRRRKRIKKRRSKSI